MRRFASVHTTPHGGALLSGSRACRGMSRGGRRHARNEKYIRHFRVRQRMPPASAQARTSRSGRSSDDSSGSGSSPCQPIEARAGRSQPLKHVSPGPLTGKEGRYLPSDKARVADEFNRVSPRVERASHELCYGVDRNEHREPEGEPAEAYSSFQDHSRQNNYRNRDCDLDFSAGKKA